jgi:hypothetical protein
MQSPDHVVQAAAANASGVQRKLAIVAVICVLVGLLGIVDTIIFYATGSRPLLPDASFWLTWPSFVLDLNLFIPGIIVGLGIRTKRRFIRIFGIILAIVWAAGAASVIGIGLYGLLHPAIQIPPGYDARAIAFFSLLLAFCVWELVVLSGPGSREYFSVVPAGKKAVTIEKQINSIATVVTIIGLLGVGNTVWFYATGTRSQFFDVALTLGWTSFVLYLNPFVPGIFIGPGLRTQTEFFRILGLIFSVVCVLATGFFGIIALVALPQAPNVLFLLYLLTLLVLSVWGLKYLFWQFNVLRGPDAIKYFSDGYDELIAKPSEPNQMDETTCPARDSNSEPPG